MSFQPHPLFAAERAEILASGFPVEAELYSPQAPGLVHWWPMDRSTGGTVYDRGFGPKNHMVMTGGLSPTDYEIHPGFGSVIDFGTNSDTIYLEAPNFTWSGGPLTISYWNFVASAATSSVCGHTGQAVANRFSVLSPWVDSNLYWDYGAAPNGRIATSYTSHLGKWTLVTLVSAGAAGAFKAIYFDGGLATSAGVSNDFTGTAEFWIGAYDFVDFTPVYHNGKVFDFRMYDRALNAGEVRALYDPETRWELYQRQRLIAFRAAAAGPGGNPKGPLGHPLHGPLGGPI